MLELIKRAFSRDAASDAFENRRAGVGRPYSAGGQEPTHEGVPPATDGQWAKNDPDAATPSVDIPVEPTSDIIVPRSAFDAWPEDSDPLVDAIVDYVNTLSNQGLFKRSEIHAVARQAFHCDYYLAQVLNGGHAQFVGNTGALIGETWDDVIAALLAIGEENHLLLAHAGQKWVQENPELAKQQTGFDGGIDPALAKLDKPFYLLNTKSPLRPKIAEWLAMHPDLIVVEDDELQGEMQNLIDAHPLLQHRKAILTCAGVTGQLSNPLQVGVSMACGRVVPPDFLVRLENGSYKSVEGEMKMTFSVKTLSGTCFATPVEGQGVTLYECTQHDNSHLPENRFDATLDDIQAYRPAEIGRQLSHVPQEEFLEAIALMTQLRAGEAIHLLSTRLGQNEVPALTILKVGCLPNGQDALICGHFVKGRVLVYKVTAQEATCELTGEDVQELARVSRAEITFHAQSHAIEVLR